MNDYCQKRKKAKGSILVGVVIMFILISSIAIAITGRSRHGAVLTTDSKKGYSAYQDSDANTEEILNNVRSLDSKNDGSIPENTLASVVCGGVCYEADQTSFANKASDIFFIKRNGISQAMTRAIFAPLPERVSNPVSNLVINFDHHNRCDAKLTWNLDGSLGNKISELEVRKNLVSDSLDFLGWTRLVSNVSTVAYPGVKEKVIKNSEFNYSSSYYFSIKAKNENSFSLDSLYYDSPVTFSVPSMNCSGGKRVGCFPAALIGSVVSSNDYTCCGGTECFECNPGWDVTGSCCTQRCQPVPSCPSGPCGGGGLATVCSENFCNPIGLDWSCNPPVDCSSHDINGNCVC